MHATSTPVGDGNEAKALLRFLENTTLCGFSQSFMNEMDGGAMGYILFFMMENNFIAANLNFEERMEHLLINIPKERVDMEFDTFLSNSFGLVAQIRH